MTGVQTCALPICLALSWLPDILTWGILILLLLIRALIFRLAVRLLCALTYLIRENSVTERFFGNALGYLPCCLSDDSVIAVLLEASATAWGLQVAIDLAAAAMAPLRITLQCLGHLSEYAQERTPRIRANFPVAPSPYGAVY